MVVMHALTQVREGQRAALLAEWEEWCDARFGQPAMPGWRAAIRKDELGVARGLLPEARQPAGLDPSRVVTSGRLVS